MFCFKDFLPFTQPLMSGGLPPYKILSMSSKYSNFFGKRQMVKSNYSLFNSFANKCHKNFVLIHWSKINSKILSQPSLVRTF